MGFTTAGSFLSTDVICRVWKVLSMGVFEEDGETSLVGLVPPLCELGLLLLPKSKMYETCVMMLR